MEKGGFQRKFWIKNSDGYELGNGKWDIPDLQTLLEDNIVPKSSGFSELNLLSRLDARWCRVLFSSTSG